MDKIQLIEKAREHKYQVLDVGGENENERYYLLVADPITHVESWRGKDVIATNRTYREGDDKEAIDSARIQDMQDDVAGMYGGRDSETYKKINWKPTKL